MHVAVAEGHAAGHVRQEVVGLLTLASRQLLGLVDLAVQPCHEIREAGDRTGRVDPDLEVDELLDESRQLLRGGLHLAPHGDAVDALEDDARAAVDLDDAIRGRRGQPCLVDCARDVGLEPCPVPGDVGS